MANHNQCTSRRMQSVKIRAKPLEGPSCQGVDFSVESDVRILSGDDKHARKNSTSHSSEMVSTADLISTVGQIWDCASSCLSRFQPKASIDLSEIISHNGSESCSVLGSDTFRVPDLAVRCLHVDLKSSIYFSTMVQQSLESLRSTHKRTYIPCDVHFTQNLFFRNCSLSCIRHDICSKKMNPANVGTLYSLVNSYGWMSQISLRPDIPLPTFLVSKKIIESSFKETAVSRCFPASGNKVSFSSNSGTEIIGSCIGMPNDLSSGTISQVIMNRIACISSLYSEHSPQTVEDTLSEARTSTSSRLEVLGDYQVSSSASGSTSESLQNIVDKGLLNNNMQQSENMDTEAKPQSEIRLSATNNRHPFLAKQEHAVSGALAGIFVSLFLHPLDTVKTVVQSCRAGGQTSICFIGQSIISERGLTGLYRGISSNITTSAPISAIYTFTYESVKGFLIPSLSKEYYSIAHCTAGACSSIATSFIFTPSEHVKQQMQVNSHYRNCWSTVFKIIEKGGLLSLYTGWGAVLCRNIPHSIIKFYTYESLKQVFMSSQQPIKQPTTLQTLLCGGLAGSTAAIVSTPFDVVKTRLQTQVPGSVRRYHSILNALQEIRKHEGVKGLYRGLIPRFVMYMTQGALFFASYEFFKSTLFTATQTQNLDVAV